jgi:WhiB family transcriptional regulator, redox-sensing transcriptional regulator
MLGVSDLPWSDLAACLGMDPSFFFPENKLDSVTAKSVCAACPVRLECLEFALPQEDLDGVWGGLNERERRRLRRQHLRNSRSVT